MIHPDIAAVLAGERRFAIQCSEALAFARSLPDASCDALVTDPPSGIGFMNNDWDKDKGGRGAWIAWLAEIMRECLRALKPGGHALVWALPRTSHWTATAAEDAGFEVRDVCVHIFGVGFPKSLNVSEALRSNGHACVCDEDVSSLQEGVGPEGPVPGSAEHDVLTKVRGRGAIWAAASHAQAGSDLRAVPAAVPSEGREGAGQVSLLLHDLRGASASGGGLVQGEPGEGGRSRAGRLDCIEPRVVPGQDDGVQQPSVEGRGYDPQDTRPVCRSALRQGPGGASADGKEGRLHHGASTTDGQDGGPPADADGSSAPHRSRPKKQRSAKPGTLADQQRPQEGGAWSLCDRCSKPRYPEGLGTALKPAAEHWILARKPLGGGVAACVTKHGTGALNIDATRISGPPSAGGTGGASLGYASNENTDRQIDRSCARGRWPANVALSHLPECVEIGTRVVPRSMIEVVGGSDGFGGSRMGGSRSLGSVNETVPVWQCAPGCAVAELDRQSGDRPGMSGGGEHAPGYQGGMFGAIDSPGTARGDSGGASRFFFCAKPSTTERELGLAHRRRAKVSDGRTKANDTPRLRDQTQRANIHPTVKSIALMRWLCRLVTPPGGVVLDVFTGSGTTAVACSQEGFRFVGCDMSEEFVGIARDRLLGDAPLLNAGGGQ